MGHRDIPVLETKRLSLRSPKAEDYPDFKATFASYRSRFMGGPLNGYAAWMLYAAEIGHWEIRGFGMWMVHLKDTGETVGMAGGWSPAKWPEREIAWIIWPDRAGKGFALEATHRVRRYFYDENGWTTAVSLTVAGNTRSETLAKRMGATPDPQFMHPTFGPMNVWRHQPADALQDGGMEAYS